MKTNVSRSCVWSGATPVTRSMRGVASAISTAMLFMQKDMNALDASSRAGVVPGMVGGAREW